MKLPLLINICFAVISTATGMAFGGIGIQNICHSFALCPTYLPGVSSFGHEDMETRQYDEFVVARTEIIKGEDSDSQAMNNAKEKLEKFINDNQLMQKYPIMSTSYTEDSGKRFLEFFLHQGSYSTYHSTNEVTIKAYNKRKMMVKKCNKDQQPPEIPETSDVMGFTADVNNIATAYYNDQLSHENNCEMLFKTKDKETSLNLSHGSSSNEDANDNENSGDVTTESPKDMLMNFAGHK